MRNFLRLATGIDYSSLLQQVFAQPELWDQFPVRYTLTGALSTHARNSDIILRYNPYRTGEDYVDKICSMVEVVDYPAWNKLPAAHEFIFALMTRVKGKHLGRTMITRVAPGKSIPPHSDLIPFAAEQFPDRSQPAKYYERYHMVLQSGPGAIFRCGDEEVGMAPGEVWWFNNQLEHEVHNNSKFDRIHLVCDIRTLSDDYIPQC